MVAQKKTEVINENFQSIIDYIDVAHTRISAEKQFSQFYSSLCSQSSPAGK
jgi:hypothetical protein